MGKHHATGAVCVMGACAGLLLAAVVPTRAVETTTEHFVARATLIQGSGSAEQAYSYVAPGRINAILYAGTISAMSDGAIVDANASWSQDEFNGVNGAHYIEFENGAMADIVVTSASTKSLSFPGNVPAGVVPGNDFLVRRHTTIGAIFGSNNEAGLRSGLNADQADNILLLIPETQQSMVFFYADIPGFEGWYRHDYLEAAEMVIYPEQGFIVRRRDQGDLTLVSDGVARHGPTRVPVYSGHNLLHTVQSSGSLTLANLNLYTGDEQTGMAPGNNPNVADNVVLILPGQANETFFYSNVPGFTGWYDASYSLSDDVPIVAGTAFFINRKAQRPMFQWNIPSQ